MSFDPRISEWGNPPLVLGKSVQLRPLFGFVLTDERPLRAYPPDGAPNDWRRAFALAVLRTGSFALDVPRKRNSEKAFAAFEARSNDRRR